MAQVSSAQLPTLARLAAGVPVPAQASRGSSSNGAGPHAAAEAPADLVMDDFRSVPRRLHPLTV
jgi:hypothetical protein